MAVEPGLFAWMPNVWLVALHCFCGDSPVLFFGGHWWESRPVHLEQRLACCPYQVARVAGWSVAGFVTSRFKLTQRAVFEIQKI